MSRNLAIVCAMIVCCGQGCPQPQAQQQPDPQPQPAPQVDRLAVTDALRVACQPITTTDAELHALLVAYDTDRSLGNTRDQEVAALFGSSSCNTDVAEVNLGCKVCGLAVIDQVYGH